MRKDNLVIDAYILVMSIAAIVATHRAHADSIPINPNDVPLFYGVLSQDPKYHDAATKAQQAFLIQTGVTPSYDKLSGYATTTVTNGVVKTIDNHTPFRSKDVFFVTGAAYTICVKKQFTKQFRDPLYHDITHTISVNPNSVSADMKIPF